MLASTHDARMANNFSGLDTYAWTDGTAMMPGNGKRAKVLGLICIAVALGRSPAQAQQPPPAKGSQEDPFVGLTEKPETPVTVPPTRSWIRALLTENFGYRKEIMSQFTSSEEGNRASRQSVGFEVLKKFSTDTATVASFNIQGRFVRRDGFNPVQNDMEGANRAGWFFFEYHNFYLDLYNVLNPLLGSKQRGQQVGRFNVRVGRFYVPFGLNLQTDTHGTVLQLSNDRNFGFERDWYTGFWGTLNKHLNYDAYYLAGSGYDLAFKGQRGLGALRLSLSNKYRSENGLEGGVSILGGERLSMDRKSPRPIETRRAGLDGRYRRAVSMDRESPRPIETRRAGLDGRYRRAVPTGLLTLTSEFSGGSDARNRVFTQLHQAEYLHASRRWDVATQYRRFRETGSGVDASLIGEFSWYFRNDAGNSNLHWIKLNIERRLERIQPSASRTVFTLQYYFYR